MGEYFANIHIGKKIKELVKEKRMSIESDIAPLLEKSKQAAYTDMGRDDWSIKELQKVLVFLDIDLCAFLQEIGFISTRSLNIAQEPDLVYKKMSQVNSEFKDKEIAMLKELLAEKERLIGVLLQK